LPLRSYRRFGQSVFHYIFQENLEKKKTKKKWVFIISLLPKQSVHNAAHYSTDLFVKKAVTITAE
jgi:hypothetical protein